MKRSILVGFGAVGAAVLAAAESIDVRLSSYNIRYATDKPEPGEEYWPVRRPHLAAQLNYETAGRANALMCFQEVLFSQLQNIQTDLGDAWSYVGIGRDDGLEAGEFSPIFYRPAAWQLLDNATYWLSETPDVVGSIGWDAMLPRIVTVAKFQHRATGEPFVYMCTHFDHLGQVARENSAELLVDLAERWATQNSDAPVFLGGDLNVRPDNPAYLTLASKMNDVKYVVPKERHYGHESTYTGFTGDPARGTEIDHIFVRDPKGLDWVSFAVLDNRFEDGVFISDHRPVVVDIKIPVSSGENSEGKTWVPVDDL